MTEDIKKLQEIGIEKIQTDTHIPIGFLQNLLQEQFDALSKLQFLGFIAILEREYALDLSELKAAGLSYFDEKQERREVPESSNGVLNPLQNEKRNFTPFYIAIAVIIFAFAIYATMDKPQHQETMLEKNTQTSSEEVLMQEIKNSQELAEKNTTQENNTTLQHSTQQADVEEVSVPSEVVIPASFVIQPKAKVWLGYIDLTNYKKYQKTFKNKLELDPSKEWLLTFGHGYIDIIIDGEVKKFKSKHSVKFHYKDGKIQEITAQEFKRYNRGRSW